MRALVVHDDPISAKLIEAALKGEGIISESAETGDDAIVLAKDHDSDIIVLGPQLPDMDGFKLIRHLRSVEVRTPVLFIAAVNEVFRDFRSVMTEADDYITAPFHKAELIARLRRIVRRSEANFDKSQSLKVTDPAKVLDVLDKINERDPMQQTGKPQQAKIFLAHAREDKVKIRKLYSALKSSGFDPWLDEVDLLPGQNWKLEIEKAIRRAGIFLACLSSHSVAKRGYVQTEFKTALSAYSERPPNAIYIIPIKLDDCDVPDMQIPDRGITLRDIHWVELFQDDGFQQLLKAIKHAFGAGLSD